MDEKLKTLARVPLFAGLKDRDLLAVGGLCDEVTVRAGKVVAKQGSSADAFYVIEDGTVRIEKDGTTMTDLGPGAFFGEMAMLARIPRTATATCVTDCSLLVIGHRELATLMDDHPSVSTAILKALAERFARTASSG